MTPRNANKRWTTKEDVLLRQALESGKSCPNIARVLHRSAIAVRRRAQVLGVSTRARRFEIRLERE